MNKNLLKCMFKCLIGLGNPGHQYHWSPHNIGFEFLDYLAEQHSLTWNNKKDLYLETRLDDILLIKPLTYMNNSGKVIPHLIKQGFTAENICVICDDIESEIFQYKLRLLSTNPGHKGHNGLKSIFSALGNKCNLLLFGMRTLELKLATSHERQDMLPKYVLEPLNRSEQQKFQTIFLDALTIVSQKK